MKKVRKSPRHIFRFKIDGGSGRSRTVTAKAKVTRARKGVDLVLTADDVRQSIEMKGLGNTQTCSMAICAKRHASDFPHPVEGYIDWQYSTAYVVTKVNKDTALPSACVVYKHYDSIAKLNDSKGGQQELLKQLEADGDRLIRLHPVDRVRKQKPGRSAGRKDGSRSSRPVGAKLRYAHAQLGGVP
jgi:hypothetical protein